jgi:hypothetical protein
LIKQHRKHQAINRKKEKRKEERKKRKKCLNCSNDEEIAQKVSSLLEVESSSKKLSVVVHVEYQVFLQIFLHKKKEEIKIQKQKLVQNFLCSV